MKHLQGLTNLKVLSLSNNSQISAAGMEYLEGLTQLTHLYLADTPMTDAGLLPITGMTQLKVLGLRATQITDRGLEHLEALSNLRHLEIRSTQSTDTGAADLRAALLNVLSITSLLAVSVSSFRWGKEWQALLLRGR